MTASGSHLKEALARGPVTLYGATPVWAGWQATRLLAPDGPPLVVLVADDDAAQRVADDLSPFLTPLADPGDPLAPDRALLIPPPGGAPYAEVSPDHGATFDRLAALYRLATGRAQPRAYVISALSLLRRVVPRAVIAARALTVRQGETRSRDALVHALLAAGFARLPIVDDPGGFACKGDVIDFFAPLYHDPIRLELDGDVVESIRTFDPATQRTLRALDEAVIHPVRETIASDDGLRARILAAADAAAHPSKETRRVLERLAEGDDFVGKDTLTPAFHARLGALPDYLPVDALWLVLDPDGIRRAAAHELELAAQRHDERVAEHKLSFPPEAFFLGPAELEAALGHGRRIETRGLELYGERGLRVVLEGHGALRAELERAHRQKADALLEPLTRRLAGWRASGHRIALVVAAGSRTERLAGLLAEYRVDVVRRALDPFDPLALPPGQITLCAGALSAGFVADGDGVVVVSEDDLFGERRHQRPEDQAAAKRARAALKGGVADFSALAAGDHLVHQLHGVGRYQGLVVLPAGGQRLDALQIVYDGGTLYLPVYRLGEVQRYVGEGGAAPRLDKLGGVTWDKTRRKVGLEVRALAEELLKLYAQRAARPGHAFPPADALYRDFEASFPFDETPDQETAIAEVLADMEAEKPMDRLICGDVGYGKTEVALRAILKCALGGKQAALLAPTTVLAEQHYQTMRARFAGFPLRLGRLSRFQSKADQVATVRALADGAIDAVVGTHRLLSNDVRFRDLGLLVIDEEQRFGVAHKERLRRLRTQLDTLTLTATPIPRTLHLSLTGLRDLSIIATPPADRRAIRTFVSRPEDGILREAIARELDRGGQIFLVAPRITGGARGLPAADGAAGDLTLEGWAERLAELAPRAKVAVAHGQLPPEALEQIMVEFVAGKHDILCSTTIIESGLDIPRANTMFVARADRFGLAQLYQLRGRIGRSKERAFCYLLVPPPEQLSDDARRRLEAMQRYAELGSGFLIASHDLELRGAGELFGAKQAGAIAQVGFETYAALLEEAVAELRGEEIVRERDPELNVEAPGFIPDDYVSDTGQRLDLYKRLASIAGEAEAAAICEEMVDRYGPLPAETSALAELMVLKAMARRLRAQSLELTRTRLTLALAPDTPLRPGRVLELVRRPKSPFRLTPDMRLLRSFDAAEQKQPTRAARAALLELEACAT